MKKADFDNLIKHNLVKIEGNAVFGYKLLKNYENYYTIEEFEHFITDMKGKYPQAFLQYNYGKGSELKQQNGRFGQIPPKMASVASSSRFCYLALRNGGKIIGADEAPKFEVGCKIRGVDGISPQLDAHFSNSNVYVEAKCHEIFDVHKPVFKAKYWDLFYGENNEFGFKVREKRSSKEFEIYLKEFGLEKSSSMFDIKQFVCHLMGIASQKDYKTPVTLLYLFFIPKSDVEEIAEQINSIFGELHKEITAIFNSLPIKKFVEKNNIKLAALAEISEVMEELSDENIFWFFQIMFF